jgi:hypothetical protein
MCKDGWQSFVTCLSHSFCEVSHLGKVSTQCLMTKTGNNHSRALRIHTGDPVQDFSKQDQD